MGVSNSLLLLPLCNTYSFKWVLSITMELGGGSYSFWQKPPSYNTELYIWRVYLRNNTKQLSYLTHAWVWVLTHLMWDAMNFSGPVHVVCDNHEFVKYEAFSRTQAAKGLSLHLMKEFLPSNNLEIDCFCPDCKCQVGKSVPSLILLVSYSVWTKRMAS